MMLPLTLLRLPPSLTETTRHRLRRGMEGLSLWLAMAMMLFVHPLYAEASVSDPELAGVLQLLDDQGRYERPALVLDSRFEVSVTGLIAETRLIRRFRNSASDWREGVFTFPLPENASVFALTMTVAERTIEGQVRPRQEARRVYQQARDNGQQAAAVEQQRPNLFTTRVANIPPGETLQVELTYQQPVHYQAGVFELRLPTTLTPRYMPGLPVADDVSPRWQGGWASATTEVADAPAISPFTVQPSDLTPDSHRVAIEVRLDAGLPLASVTSPSHALSRRLDGTVHQVRLAQGTALMDRDFVLRWQPLGGHAPSAALFHQRVDGEDYLMAMVVPPTQRRTPLPRELVFVIDTSGSMAGASIDQARQALARGLDTLRPQDTFNIIQFNSQPAALFPEPRPADDPHLARARRYVDRLDADGGTEMAPALALALQARASDEPARVRQVVFMTDGAVGNEAALFRQIRDQLGDRRLFTVGIGSAPNLHFMREAARWGRGTFTAVSDASDLAGPLAALFQAMQAPVLTDLRIDWPGGRAEALPQRPGDLFAGQPLVQTVRGVAAEGSVRLSGSLASGERWSRTLDLQQAAPGQGLGRQWARARIDQLLDQADVHGEVVKDAVVELAVRHGLVSPYTSFVAVDTTPARPAEAPLSGEAIPTLLPAGSHPQMLRYPQTATVGPLFSALGLLGLMFSLALALLRGRAAQ